MVMTTRKFGRNSHDGNRILTVTVLETGTDRAVRIIGVVVIKVAAAITAIAPGEGIKNYSIKKFQTIRIRRYRSSLYDLFNGITLRPNFQIGVRNDIQF